jgi:hypothetical protein
VQAANGPAISSASGQPIKCWGWQDSVVKFGGRKFCWRFLLTAISFPLLGADFLEHYELVVDLAKFRVTQQDGYSVQLKSPPIGGSCALLGVRPAAETKQLPEVIHQVEHHIETDGRLVAAKYRRLNPEKLAAAKREFADLERQGIIRRSNSQ